MKMTTVQRCHRRSRARNSRVTHTSEPKTGARQRLVGRKPRRGRKRHRRRRLKRAGLERLTEFIGIPFSLSLISETLAFVKLSMAQARRERGKRHGSRLARRGYCPTVVGDARFPGRVRA